MTGQEYPWRLVDRFGHGWLHTGGGIYTTFPLRDWPSGLAYAELDAQRGPLAPVGPPPTADTDELVLALYSAGRQAVGTVLVAFAALAAEYSRTGSGHRLTAGRPESWESDLILSLAWSVGADIKPHRIHEPALLTVRGILARWTNPRPGEQYVEVAENMAGVLGRLVDVQGGFDAVADQWLVQHNRLAGCPGDPECTCRVGPLRNYVTYRSRNHNTPVSRPGR